jgi:hypothetical protein
MSARIQPNKVKSRELEEVREVDPDGRIVVHHRLVDTLGRMLKSGTIDQAMHDAGRSDRSRPKAFLWRRLGCWCHDGNKRYLDTNVNCFTPQGSGPAL